MNVAFVEVAPAFADLNNSAPPLALLSLAYRVRQTGASVSLLPHAFWNSSEPARQGLNRADIVCVWVDPFNFKAVCDSLPSLSGYSSFVVGFGPMAEASPDLLLEAGIRPQKEAPMAELSESWMQMPLPPHPELKAWPRWDCGISNQETFGFPINRQPHPWNCPRQSEVGRSQMEEWLRTIVTPLVGMRKSLLYLAAAPGAWDRQGMDLLGELCMQALNAHGTEPLFAARARAGELLAESVLPSLGLLPLERLEVLAEMEIEGTTCRRRDDTLAAVVTEAARVGVGASCCLRFLLGLPGEDVNCSVEVIRNAVRTAAASGMGAVQFEWWYNVPGSELFAESRRSDLTPEHRSGLQSFIQLMEATHPQLAILGPELPEIDMDGGAWPRTAISTVA